MIDLNKIERKNIYSQFGEDALTRAIFEELGIKHPVCVEFGANDGLSCSNTAQWWKLEARALLIEKDKELYEKLCKNTQDFELVGKILSCVSAVKSHDGVALLTLDDFVRPWLNLCTIREPDLISCDVDGDEYHIVKASELAPTVWIVEYNPTFPLGYDFVQEPGDCIGCSLSALDKLMYTKNYKRVAVTDSNGIYVHNLHGDKFALGNTEAMDKHQLKAVSDYKGNIRVIGNPPWGMSGKVRGM